MADKEKEPIQNFGIEETADMGAGDAQLLSDLMTPETSTSDPDDIQKIDDTPDKGEDTPEKKEDISKPKEDEKEDQSYISDFLYDDEEEEEEKEEEEDLTKKVKTNPEDEKESTEDTPKGESTEEEESEEESEKEEEDDLPTQFAALANDLFKVGVFTKDDGEDDVVINSPEDFLERFNLEKKKGAMGMIDNFLGQFGEDYKQAFDAIFVKGVNPKEYFGTFNEVVDFAELSLDGDENEANQMKVVRQSLSDQGFEPEDVDDEVERLRDIGDLEKVAKRHHKVLIKKKALQLQEKEREAEIKVQQQAAIRNEYIKNVQQTLQEKLKGKEFDGIPLNARMANELQDFLLVDKWKTASGETLTDFDRSILELKKPENHATKVKIALLLKTLEKDPTLSTIQKSAISKKSDDLFSSVVRQQRKGSVKTKKSNTQGSNTWRQLL